MRKPVLFAFVLAASQGASLTSSVGSDAVSYLPDRSYHQPNAISQRSDCILQRLSLLKENEALEDFEKRHRINEIKDLYGAFHAEKNSESEGGRSIYGPGLLGGIIDYNYSLIQAIAQNTSEYDFSQFALHPEGVVYIELGRQEMCRFNRLHVPRRGH